jgi:hypothetical protein
MSDSPTAVKAQKHPKSTGELEADALASFNYYLTHLSPQAAKRVLTYAVDKAGYALSPLPTGTPASDSPASK